MKSDRSEKAKAPLSRALTDHFRSVDSAPAGFSIAREPSVANGFFVTFTALSLVLLVATIVASNRGILIDQRDLVLATAGGDVVRMPIRLFFVAFFATYALYAAGTWGRRGVLALQLLGELLVVFLLVDVAAVVAARQDWFTMPVYAQQLLSGLGAVAVFPHVVLTQARLPRRSGPQPLATRVPWRSYLAVAGVLAAGAVAATWALRHLTEQVEVLRSVALLGGVGPGLFLILQVFSLVFVVVGWRALVRGSRQPFHPPLAVLVPAHNEAHDIGDTIAAVDAAAATYRGPICLYVVDNCSVDDTAEVAAKALANAHRIDGEVLSCDRPGKAVALNHGLAHIEEDFVVRIDADTVIEPGCLEAAMRHLRDPRVAAVGGLPLPTARRTWIDRVRLVEVLLRHGFYQVVQGGFGGVVGVPGMFAVYRRQAVLEVGGTAEGMNGEDTDIVLRMVAAGYRAVSDPRARYRSETPATYAHLREQRLRWFRSVYHVVGHNRDLLFRPAQLTGTLVLPYMLASAALRAALAPLVLFAGLVLTVFGAAYPTLAWQPVVAMVLGTALLVSAAVCLAWRMPRALVDLPAYLGFRLLRSYFTLASALTLVYPPLAGRRRGPAPSPATAPGHEVEPSGPQAEGSAASPEPAGSSRNRSRDASA
jgi:cellulose synthase/poly-beta-1,6-N-acetylglucosamine synthase-like glycosyltransferase